MTMRAYMSNNVHKNFFFVMFNILSIPLLFFLLHKMNFLLYTDGIL